MHAEKLYKRTGRHMNAIMQKKEHIILTAIELFARQGVGVSTAEIAKTAEIANGTLFYNFEKKQDLLDATYLYIKKETLYAVSRGLSEDLSLQEKLAIIWENYIEWSVHNKSKHKALSLLKSSQVLTPDVVRESEILFADLFTIMRSALDEKEVKELPFPLLCNIAFAQLDALFEYINNEELSQCKLKQMTKISFEVFLTGIKI